MAVAVNGALTRRGQLLAWPRRMRLSSVIAPRDREFFDLFEEAGGNIVRAADLLDEMLRDYPGHGATWRATS